MNLPERKPDYHEVLTEAQLGEAIVAWLMDKGRIPKDVRQWHAMQTVHDIAAKVVHAKLWREP